MQLSLIAAVVASGFFSPASAATVNVGSLVRQMWDFSYLTQPPEPAFTMTQASSYDRASNPGPHQDWFANGDAGQFVRTESNAGRTEQVMADVKGPGSVVRVWSANPQGTIRFYIDGETTARLTCPMEALLTGKVLPFGDPFAYKSSAGTNLCFPLPYAKSLKVTAEGTRGLYYHVGYRTYAPGTSVEPFDPAKLGQYSRQMRQAAEHLSKLEPYSTDSPIKIHESSLSSGQSDSVFSHGGGGTVPFFSVLLTKIGADPFSAKDPRLPNILRHLIIHADFDGERCIECPLGDFFGTAPGINELHTLPFEVSADGRMACRLPMPFMGSAEIKIENTGSDLVELMAAVGCNETQSTESFYHFKAQWTADYASTRPMRDMEFLNVNGEGYWIGSNLHVANPTPAWWGEGDEKVFVDGESFPSTFGTGTEDYYGYAWCSPELFQRPYHAQSRCDGPANYGQTNVHRWQLFDPIPYTKSMKFDMEMWHWEDVKAAYARTAYWYAKPGGTGPVALNKSLLAPPNLGKYQPKHVDGAIEGEDLKILETHGGKTSIQNDFWQISGGKQLWWIDNQPGNRLVLQVPVASAGTYEVVGCFCHAGDYGIHKMTLNGQVVAPIDFYIPGLEWRKSSLGTFTLPAGNVKLEVECVGKNPEASDPHMFGLDYLLLKKK